MDERLTRAESIFQSAVDLPPDERAALLSDQCGNDSELRALVERLLARHDDGMGSFLEPDSSPTQARTEEPPGAPSTAERIGPYVLRDRLGAGGMGEVWKAEQTEPVRRTVALKLIKAGMDSTQVLARFEAERQALALMDHPYIAKVHDAGVTDGGRPYFVMEHVPGLPITDYCDQRRLSTKERLELFEKVCEGVQHAHQKAVIHRDIKPTNILVADVDGKPLPKIIDFGVAKATTQKLTERTMHTALGQVIGTPEYMSPEQADLTSEDVDTRTDVYSLGVVLYELLAGALPFEPEELRKSGLEGILKTLREKDPPRPSTKVSTSGEKTTEIAERRRTEPRRLVGQLRGDLDWIVMRALEKNRTRRYGAPRELAQDVRRHLDDQPVIAGPPSAVYRSRKFVKRHRVGVGFAATVSFAVILALVLITAQNARTAAARDDAEAARDEAEAVTTALEEMLSSVDPAKSGPTVTVRAMLDRTATTLEERFGEQPLIEARLRSTVGNAYHALGEYEAAEEHLQRATKIRRERLGPEDPQTLAAMINLGNLYVSWVHPDSLEPLAREVVETGRRVFGPEDVQTLRGMYLLGVSCGQQGRKEEAAELYRACLETSRRVLGEDHPQTLASRSALGILATNLGRYDEAVSYLRENLEIWKRTVGEEHPVTTLEMANLAIALGRAGSYEEAVTMYERAHEIRRRVLGDEHPRLLRSMEGIAELYESWGRLEGAEAMNRKALEFSGRLHGDGHATTNALRYDLARRTALQGKRADALRFLRDAVDHDYRGPSDSVSIRDEPAFAVLHDDAEFEAIVEEIERRNEERATAAD
jgi:serine/threonine protein kinase/tetratricopeptide (TPR) repeat protein